MNEKINILFLHAGAELYGADKVLLDLLVRLDKSRFNPIVVLPTYGVLVNKLMEHEIEVHVIDYPILRRKYFNFKGIFSYPFQYIKYSNEIIKLVRDKNINIIHVNTTAVLEGVYLKCRLNVPMIWHVHEILLHPRFLFKFICFLIERYADKVVVVSQAVKEHLLSSHIIKEPKIKVIYNGVDNNVYNKKAPFKYLESEFDLPANSIVVGMIGRINSWKGQEDFIDALQGIIEENPNVYGILVGDVYEGEEYRRDRLINKVNETGLKENFRLTGFRNDTRNLYNLFDIFVLPSIQPDPLPTVVLEAMATGKAIVAYDHGGVTEMVKNNYNGLLCEVRSPGDLSKAIQKIIVDENFRKKLGDNSLERQMNFFSLENYLDNFSDLYQQLSKGNRINDGKT